MSLRKAIAREDQNFTEEGAKLEELSIVVGQLRVVKPGE